MPLGQCLILRAAVPDLILDLLGLVIPVVSDNVPAAQRGDAAVAFQYLLVAQLHLLIEISSVEQLLVQERASLLIQRQIFLRAFLFSQMLCHLRARLQRRQIHALQPGARPEQLHIQRVMLPPLQHAVLVRIPAAGILRAPRKLQRSFDTGPQLFEELLVAAELPVAVGLDHAAHLPVHAGHIPAAFAAQRQRQTEPHRTVGL